MSRRRNRVKNKARLVVSMVILLAVIGVSAYVGFNIYLARAAAPVDPFSANYVNVTIPSGASTERIGVILNNYGLIRDVTQFKLISRLEGYDGTLRAGSFTLSPAMTVQEILEVISVGGSADTKRFTIPEGLNISRTADRLEGLGFIDREEFMYAVENGEFLFTFIEELPSGPDRLEGFLFPETYDVFVTATEEDIINRMLTQFNLVFTDEYRLRAQELGRSIYEIITIASLIEAEVRIDVDRPKVASVIYNRLEIGMPLQLCATVQYALGEQKPRLSIADTQIDHPYNTYRFTGLPPGPIGSPGARAIHAALYPAESDYIFFVLKPDGSGEHNFATNINDFNRYRRQYLNSLN